MYKYKDIIIITEYKMIFPRDFSCLMQGRENKLIIFFQCTVFLSHLHDLGLIPELKCVST